MPRSVLLDESRDIQWPLGLPGYGDKIRLQPTLAEFFDAHRPANCGKGQFLIESTLTLILVKQILGFRFKEVHRTLGNLIGLDTPVGNPLPSREVESGFSSLPDVVGEALRDAKRKVR